MSGGTRATTAESLLERGYAFRGGRLVEERLAARLHTFSWHGKPRQGISVGTSEAFSLPRLQPALRDVEVYLGWFGKLSRGVQASSAVTAAITRVPGARAGLRAAAQRFVKTSTGGPDEQARASGGSLILAEALDRSGAVLERVELHGASGYSFTGAFLAWAGEQLAAGDSDGSGALGPAEAFGLERLRAGVAEAGISEVS